MAQLKGLARIEDQRRLLIAESARLRGEIGAEMAAFKQPLEWVGKGWSVFERVRPFWPLIVMAAGFAVTRKGGGLLSVLSRITSWLQVGRRVFSLWREFSSEQPQPEPPLSHA